MRDALIAFMKKNVGFFAFLILELAVMAASLCGCLGVVVSGSMLPTLKVGTFYAADIRDRTPDYDDIVIFYPFCERDEGHSTRLKSKENRAELYIKRCVGLPGDTIAVKDGYLYRNGVIIIRNYTADRMIDYTMEEVTLGEDEYFMMGDNRNDSYDSHIMGAVKQSHIAGVVKLQFWCKTLELLQNEKTDSLKEKVMDMIAAIGTGHPVKEDTEAQRIHDCTEWSSFPL